MPTGKKPSPSRAGSTVPPLPSGNSTGNKDPNKIECYGGLYPKGVTRLAVEFDCYRNNITPEMGGLGAEGHFRNAFKIVWPNFEWNEWCEVLITAWCNNRIITVIGHQRASKTYTLAHILYLDYWAACTTTLTSIATVTFEGLRLRMWADTLRAAENAVIKPPFTIQSTTNACKIYPTEFAHQAGERFQVQGMSVSRTADAPGRIRGGHADRRRIILDEAQDMPDAIFDAMVNPMSAPDAKVVLLSNPVEKISKFGSWCEPEAGWASVDETDLCWKAKKGGIVVHFDGLQSPNIKAGKTIFPYMLTQESINDIERAHGRDSIQFWSLVRGWFPPDGIVARVFPNSTLEKCQAGIKFDYAPQMCATLDPAFEFDNSPMHFGQLGLPVFGERSYKVNATETLLCQYNVGPMAEPKDYQCAHWVMRECRARGVLPKHFIMDITGNARGVYAILQKEWSPDVQGINYAGAATDRNLRGDDTRKANDLYTYFITEAWFRASEFCKEGLIGGLENLDPRTRDELSARRYFLKQGTKGMMMAVEPKPEFKKRIGRSPDFADSFVGFGELLLRLGTQPGGGIMQRLKAGSMWDKAKERAKRAQQVYVTEGAF